MEETGPHSCLEGTGVPPNDSPSSIIWAEGKLRPRKTESHLGAPSREQASGAPAPPCLSVPAGPRGWGAPPGRGVRGGLGGSGSLRPQESGASRPYKDMCAGGQSAAGAGPGPRVAARAPARPSVRPSVRPSRAVPSPA